MCNLSQGVEERGIEKGLAEAVLRIYKKGYSIEQISDLLDMNIEKIKAIIESKLFEKIKNTVKVKKSFGSIFFML